MQDALLTNAAYQVVTRVSWQRAITLVVTDVVDVVENHPTRVIRSAGGLVIKMPTIVRQRRYAHISHDVLPRSESATRAAILLRDKRTCGYCGGRGDTIDHVVPQSRSGRNTWANLITACSACNQRKADRTPVEAGMKLLWMPYAPTAHAADQERVWLALDRAA